MNCKGRNRAPPLFARRIIIMNASAALSLLPYNQLAQWSPLIKGPNTRLSIRGGRRRMLN